MEHDSLHHLTRQTQLISQCLTEFTLIQRAILEGIGEAQLDTQPGKCKLEAQATPVRYADAQTKIQISNLRQRLGHQLSWDVSILQDLRDNNVIGASTITLAPTWTKGQIPLVLRQRLCSHEDTSPERKWAHPHPWILDIYDYGGGNTRLCNQRLARHVSELYALPKEVRKQLIKKIHHVVPDNQGRVLTFVEALVCVRAMTSAFLFLV